MANVINTIHILDVRGDLACLSRPELKTERFSYPCLTPSAARGVFDAIYCKPPEFRWQISKIEILNPIAYIPLRRNEVSEVVSSANVKKWIKGTASPSPLFADDPSVRQQRQTMALRDVRYRIHGRMVPWANCKHPLKALNEQFVRRARSGKCINQPYLGCREFVAFFELVENLDEARARHPSIPHNQDIGLMLYDVFDLSRPGTSSDKPHISVFHAEIRDGVLEIPDYEDSAVLKPERRAG